MSLLLPATLLLAISAPGATGTAPGLTIELPAIFSHGEAHVLLADIRSDAFDICRRENRHGAMAARSARLCASDLVGRTVAAAHRPVLTEVHRESTGQRNCPNMPERGERD